MYCDGDVWSYRIGYSCQHEPPAPPPPWFTIKWAIDETIDKVQRTFPNANIIITMTDEVHNYRIGVSDLVKYKGGRISTKPYFWRKIRDYFYSLPNVVVSENEEADDLMSKALMKGSHVACVSVDKDLKNTPGVHFNDMSEQLIHVNPAQAYRNFYMQLLTGDQIDNIKGCPRIGKTKAAELLRDCRTPEEFECVIGLAYASAKGYKLKDGTFVPMDDPEARMIEMGQLLWMRRVDDEMWNLRANGFTTKDTPCG